MEYEDRLIIEFFVTDLIGKEYHHKADQFGDFKFAKNAIKKCIKKIRYFVDRLECHERLRLSIHRNLDHMERSLKTKSNARDFIPVFYALAVMWNLLGGLGRIRYWELEYVQDELSYLSQKEFLDKESDMIQAAKDLQKTARDEQVSIIKKLKKDKRTVVEIAQIINLPESRVRKILRET